MELMKVISLTFKAMTYEMAKGRSGAPKPGGARAPRPGGYQAPAPGGPGHGRNTPDENKGGGKK